MSDRKNAIKTRCEWETLNFTHTALQAIQREFSPSTQREDLPRMLTSLNAKIQKKKKKVGVYVRFGCESVLFFLKNPLYIKRMKSEMDKRWQMRHDGKDVSNIELDDPVLRAHCREQAACIFERNNESGAGEWSAGYCYIRHNYTETMGRACLAAEFALTQLTRICPPPSAVAESTPPEPAPRDSQSDVSPDRLVIRGSDWHSFHRPPENELNLLLNNKCDDNVPDEVENPVSEPQKVTTHTYYQPDLPGFPNIHS